MYILNIFPVPRTIICACTLIEDEIFIYVLFTFLTVFKDSVSIDCLFNEMAALSDEVVHRESIHFLFKRGNKRVNPKWSSW